MWKAHISNLIKAGIVVYPSPPLFLVKSFHFHVHIHIHVLIFCLQLKPGPRESPFQCFIRRDRATSTYLLYFGLVPCKSFLFTVQYIVVDEFEGKKNGITYPAVFK